MKKGFSLLEVIIALALVAIVIFPLNTAFRKGQALAHHNYLKQQAISLATSLLESETYTGPTSITIENSFNFDIEKNAENIIPEGKQVTVTINWQDQLQANNNIVLTKNYYPGIN